MDHVIWLSHYQYYCTLVSRGQTMCWGAGAYCFAPMLKTVWHFSDTKVFLGYLKKAEIFTHFYVQVEMATILKEAGVLNHKVSIIL